jgi:hypothetical protein
MLHNLNHQFMLHLVKGFFKIKFKNNNITEIDDIDGGLPVSS